MNESLMLRYFRVEERVVARQATRRRLSPAQDRSDNRAGESSGNVTPPDAA